MKSTAYVRLFRPDQDDHDLPPSVSPLATLSSWYFSEYYQKTFMSGLAQPTLREYARSVKLWADLTGDPPLVDIDGQVCAEFAEKLGELPGKVKGTKMSGETQDKHRRQLQAILDRAGARGVRKSERNNIGLYEIPPLLPDVDKEEPIVENDFTLEEIIDIVAACDKMTCPLDLPVSPSLWWKSLVSFLYYTGCRIGETLTCRFDFVRIRRGRHFLVIPAKNRKGKKGKRKPKVIALTPEMLQLLQAIHTDREFIFPLPVGTRHFYRLFEDLLDAASIPKDRQFGFHGFRRAHASALDPKTAQESLGHSSVKTTLAHYFNAEKLAEDLQAKLTPLHIRPAHPDIVDDDERQKALF